MGSLTPAVGSAAKTIPVLDNCRTPHKASSGKRDFRCCLESCRIVSNGVISPDSSQPSRDPTIPALSKILTSLNGRTSEINRILKELMSQDKIVDGDMLALQGMMLNFNQDVMAVSKIVESLMNSLKTTLQTQV